MKSSKITTFFKPSGDDKNEEPTDGDKLLPTKKKLVTMDKRQSKESLLPSRLSYYEYVDMEVQRALDRRDFLKIEENIDGETVDVTPKPIDVAFDTEDYKKLKKTLESIQKRRADSEGFKGTASSLMRTKSSRGVGFHLSMEDIVTGIGSERMLTDLRTTSSSLSPYIDVSSSSSSLSSLEDQAKKDLKSKFNLPFIRVVLRKTELILLYEQQSMTAIRNTEDGNSAEQDNKQYDYLTIGKGKVRRRSDAETQTNETLFKSRKVNTIRKDTTNTGSYVSYFEMFDTYRKLGELDPFSEESEGGKGEKESNYQQKMSPEEQYAAILKLPSFHWASTVVKRMLAGNNFEKSQRRFRNMDPIPKTVSQIDYKYSLKNLFTILPYARDNERRAVSDMSFCYSNSDILAVAYGIYSYQAAKLPNTGEVCIWSIKNPFDPERYYFYNYPVVSLEFSPYRANLLAIGLFDGTVEVRDISRFNEPPVAVSQRSSSPGVDPVLAIKWIKQASGADGGDEIDPFLSLSQDGSVTRFHIIRSPHLLGNKQMGLERIEGKPEGLPVTVVNVATQEANPRPQCLNLTKHPLHLDIYYILTDEGCLHKCSTNYQHHYLEVLKTHKGAVNSMDFSPWSPKLFLTCDNDWYIRIWMEGIFKPLITLQNMYGPYQWAGWSRTHSTVLIALNRKQCEIWDLKRSTLKPVSVHTLGSSYNTLALFSRDGNSIAIGNERGKVFMQAFEEMPFAPHYQYDALEKAILNAVNNFPELLIELKSLGYFGYPNKGMVIPP